MSNSYNLAVDLSAILADTNPLKAELDKRKVCYIIKQAVSANTYTNIVDITDKGILNGIRVYNYEGEDPRIASIKIVVDGVTKFDDQWGNYGTATYRQGSLSFCHQFETSLQVQAKVSLVGEYINVIVAYTTDE